MKRYVLRGGRVVDPYSGVDQSGDVTIIGDRIGSADAADATGPGDIDVQGMLVVPGLIDSHVHVYEGVSHYGVDADTYCLNRGVTTAVDAGSAGAQTYLGFHRLIVERSRSRLFAFLNISTLGLLSPEIEVTSSTLMVVRKAIDVIGKYPEEIVGVKVRLGRPTVEDPVVALERAKLVARETGLRLMVHITDMDPSLEAVLGELRAGDVITHCYHGRRGGVIDENGDVRAAVWSAVERDVRLDVGHGAGSFSFAVAEKAIAAGLVPHFISSDLHFYNVDGPVFDLVTTMSKLMHAGMTVGDAIAATTVRPAEALGLAEDLGSLRPGSTGDVTVLEMVQGPWVLCDAEGRKEVLDRRLVPRWVVKGGELTRINYESQECKD